METSAEPSSSSSLSLSAMSLISMAEARLPPGFRFHPRDEELVLDYLCRKLAGGGGAYGGVAMVDVDLNKCEPWDLPDEACVGGREWYFFSLHDRKYATGQRTNRATESGYWKATGKDRAIVSRRDRARAAASSSSGASAVVVGMRKTLVFYQGRAPRGTKSEWVMHEFRVEGHAAAAAAATADHPASASSSGLPPPKEDWVLCRVFYKSRTATPRPAASDEAGSLSGDLSAPPVLMHLPMAAAPAGAAYATFVAAPSTTMAALDGGGGYYHEGLPAPAHHRPAPLPFTSFRDLLSSMVDGGGGAVAEAALRQDWSEDGCALLHQSGMMPQSWNPF